MSAGRTEGPSDTPAREAVARFAQFLATKHLRLTGARAAIVEAALSRRGHYPLEELIADLKRRGIRGSKATVYRTLPLLVEAGMVQAAVLAGDARTYETTFGRQHHDHLRCARCGRIVEFEFEAFELLQRDLAQKHGFRLESHHHELVGTCPACLAREGSEGGGTPATER